MKIRFFDFDGCLFNTPLPDVGKELWHKRHGEVYPHKGWWGRVESMCLDTFDIKPVESTLNIFNDGKDNQTIDYVLTSRLPKFTDIIKELLKRNNIDIKHVMTKNKYEKGERILQTINELKTVYNITDVYFYDDRDKEIVSANSVKKEIEDMGYRFHIKKIKSINHD